MNLISLLYQSVALAFSLLVLPSAQATSLPLQMQGKIVYVDDGDTLVLLDAQKQQHKIRLTDSDAPESPKEKYKKLGQPYSVVSGRHLAEMAKGRDATAHCYEYDRHERLVCRVFVDNKDVSLEQIRAGMAWANGANKRYVRDRRAYEYQHEAKAARRGLWADPNPVEPWVWRRSCWKEGNCKEAGQ